MAIKPDNQRKGNRRQFRRQALDTSRTKDLQRDDKRRIEYSILHNCLTYYSTYAQVSKQRSEVLYRPK